MTMRCEQFSDRQEYLKLALPFLEDHPWEGALIYDLMARLDLFATPGDPPLLWVAIDGDQVHGVALRTDQAHSLILACASVEAAQCCLEQARTVPGLRGVFGACDYFDQLRAEINMLGRYEQVMHLGYYDTNQIKQPRNIPGTARVATLTDVPLLVQWAQEFQDEAMARERPPPVKIESIEKSVEAGKEWLWQADDKPVAGCIWTAKTKIGTKVTRVYTPPPLRGRGYASALVAAVSQNLLDAGSPRVGLFTDLSNGASNHLYQKIGYVRRRDFKHLQNQELLEE